MTAIERELLATSPVLSFAVDAFGLIRLASAAARETLGGGDDLVGHALTRYVRPTDVEKLVSPLAVGEPAATVSGAVLTAADGTTRVTDLHVVDRLRLDGVECLLLHAWDVSNRQAEEDHWHEAALHDGLTGLPGRVLLQDRLQVAMDRLTRAQVPVSVMFVDLRDFKAINDTAGHPAGDAVLKEISARLKLVLRPSDTVARWGGDEFVILCEGLADGTAREVARRIVASVAQPLDLPDGPRSLHASVGVAVVVTPGVSPERALHIADEAMYAARHASGQGGDGGLEVDVRVVASA